MDAALYTRTDLNLAATKAQISHEARNSFMRMLQAEHCQRGAREQLKELWTAWVSKNYEVAPLQNAKLAVKVADGAAPTPPDTPDGA